MVSNTKPSRWEGKKMCAIDGYTLDGERCEICFSRVLALLLEMRPERREDRYTHCWVLVCPVCDVWFRDPSDAVAQPAPSPSECIEAADLARYEPTSLYTKFACASFAWRRHETCGEPILFVVHGRIDHLPGVEFCGSAFCADCDVWVTPPVAAATHVPAPSSLRIEYETHHHEIQYDHAERIHGDARLEAQRHALESAVGSFQWPDANRHADPEPEERVAELRRVYRSFFLRLSPSWKGEIHAGCGTPLLRTDGTRDDVVPWWYAPDGFWSLFDQPEFCPACDCWIGEPGPSRLTPREIPVAMWVVRTGAELKTTSARGS